MVALIEHTTLKQLPDSKMSYIPNFLSSDLATQYFEELLNCIPWTRPDNII